MGRINETTVEVNCGVDKGYFTFAVGDPVTFRASGTPATLVGWRDGTGLGGPVAAVRFADGKVTLVTPYALLPRLPERRHPADVVEVLSRDTLSVLAARQVRAGEGMDELARIRARYDGAERLCFLFQCRAARFGQAGPAAAA